MYSDSGRLSLLDSFTNCSFLDRPGPPLQLSHQQCIRRSMTALCQPFCIFFVLFSRGCLIPDALVCSRLRRSPDRWCVVGSKRRCAPFAPHNTPSIHDAAEPAREYVVLWRESVLRLSLPTRQRLSMMPQSQRGSMLGGKCASRIFPPTYS